MTIKETRIILLLLVAASAAAQTTTVTGTITDPAGDLLSGSCSIQAVGPFSAATGWRVTGAPMVVPFSGGSFSAALAPTDSATPSGQYYRVTCSVPNQTVSGRAVGAYSWGPRYWLVPTNITALDIGTVEITSPPPSPSWKVLWPQMDQGGANLGQVPQWNGSSWMPSNISLTGVTTTQSGTGAVARPIQAKLNDLYSLSDYGGNCNGSADNTTPFANAIAAIVANGGGHLIIPAGTCISSTINLPEGVPFWMQGQGVDATTVKLKNGANADLMTQADFSALTGTNSPGGVFRLHLSDMTLDGNKSNQSGTSWPIRLFNHGSSFENLIAQNGLTGGIYSEWGTDSTFATTAQDLEDGFTNIKAIFNGTGISPSTVTFAFAKQGAGFLHSITIGANTYYYLEQASDTAASVAAALVLAFNDPNANATATGASSVTLTATANSSVSQAVSATDGNTPGTLVENQTGDGILFRGPHDSVMQNVIAYQNTGWGFHNQTHGQPTSPPGVFWNGGGVHISHLNTYLDTLGGAFTEDGVICTDCAFTTATGPGQLIPYYAGGINVTMGTWASWYGYGLSCANANNNLQGFFGNSATTTTGIFFNGCEFSRLDFNFFDLNGPMLYVRGGTQNNIIKITGEANLFGSPGVLGSTTLFDPRGIQGFPLNNCVEINIGGPQGALATKYSIPCVNSAMQIDNTNQYLGVNVAPLYPLDVQPLQPSAWTIAFSSTGTAPYATGTGYVHSIMVGGTTYSYTQLSGDTSAGIATTMAGLVNAAPDPNVTATINGIYVTLTVKLNTGARVVVSASDYNGSTTLTEDYQLVHNTARFFNATQNTQLLLGQQTITDPTNLLISMQASGPGNADLWIAGQSTTAIPHLWTWAEDYQIYNQDATGYTSFTVNGGTAQASNPFFTVKSRAGTTQFQINSSGQACLGAPLVCISSWPSTSGFIGTSPTAAQTIYNSGAGYTQLALQDSGTQLANSQASLLIYNNAGTKCGFMGTSGLAMGDCANYKQLLSGVNLSMSSDSVLSWKNANNVFSGAYDVGLARESPGSLKVTNGSSGYGSLDAGQLCISAACISAWPAAGAVTSVFGRTGAVVSAIGDYTAAQVTNAVSTLGSYASPAWLTAVPWSIVTGAPTLTNTVFGRSGAVTAQSGDYTAAQVTNAMSLSPTGLQTVYNSGAGYTQIAMQDSAAQAPASQASLLFYNNAGTKCAFAGATSGWAMGDCTNYKFLFSGSTAGMASDAVWNWKNSNNVYAGAYDVGLARAVAGGILKVTNGSSGYGTLDAGGLSINGTPLATVAVSGSYSDLSNKPAIPAAQVNSDWTAASGVAQILNRPALAAVATSGSYTDLSNKPAIPGQPIFGGCSSTVASNATVVLTPFQLASINCSSTTSWAGPPMPRAGTISNLYVQAKTASNTVGSGVVTVFVAGAATLVTCTLSTATTCNDTTHTATIAAGQQLTVKVQSTAASGDTLADVYVGFLIQ